MELIDASLLEEPQISEILRCTQIAMLCVQSKRADRPTMSDVLMMLKCKSMVLPVPKALDGRKEEASSRKKRKKPLMSRHRIPVKHHSTNYLASEENEKSSSYLSCCSDDVDNSHASSIVVE